MFNYSKPRRGISKEEAAKRNYFDIYARHFGKITSAGVWYLLTNALFFIAAYILIRGYFIGENYDNIVLIISKIIKGENFFIPFIPFVPFLFIGPFTAGYTYLIRSYSKQSPTFMISDYFEHTKRNFKHSLITSAISTVFSYLLAQAFVFYNAYFIANGMPVGILYTLFAIVLILYIIMMFYVYPIMVTFKMKLSVIFKNAWTFTVLKLPQNLFVFAIVAFVDIGLLYLLSFKFFLPDIIYFFVFAFLLLGFTAFTANFYIWHVMNKYIVSYVTPKRNEAAVFDDDTYPDIDDDDYPEEVEIEDEYLL